MNTKLKLTLGVLPVLLSMAITSAHAGMEKSKTDTLDFSLTEPATAEVFVTPETALNAGKLDDKAKLATAAVSLNVGKGAATDLGVKWVITDDGGTIDAANPEKYSLVSTSDNHTKLKVKLAQELDGTSAAKKASSTEGYVGKVEATETGDMTLYVLVDGAQTSVPGTYHGVLQAAAFTQ